MKFCSRIQYDSTACPGVVFVLNKMNEKRRVERELKIAALRVKVREGSAAIQTALDNIKDQPADTSFAEQYAAYESLVHAEWRPAWIRWGLHSITGLDIDDQPATVETLIACGPDDLVDEIFTAIQKEAGLSAEETKNSPSPGTSGSQADGATASSTAGSASDTAGTRTPDATVQSTSPQT